MKRFDPKLAQVGDILCYEPLEIGGHTICFFSDLNPLHLLRPKVSHVSVISRIEKDGTIWIIESHIDSGVVEKILNPKWYPTIWARRYKRELTPSEKKELITWMQINLIGHDYDEWSFPSKFFRQFFFAKEDPKLNSKSKYDCAETIAVGFFYALRIALHPTINMRTINPTQLMYSHELRDIN